MLSLTERVSCIPHPPFSTHHLVFSLISSPFSFNCKTAIDISSLEKIQHF